jgi:hypothetical protein
MCNTYGYLNIKKKKKNPILPIIMIIVVNFLMTKNATTNMVMMIPVIQCDV